jgi:hypothetical protein
MLSGANAFENSDIQEGELRLGQQDPELLKAVEAINLFTYSGEVTGTPNGDAPSILNSSYNFKAEVEVPDGGGNGMLVTQGGRFGGYGFYILKGKPIFLWNLVDLKRVRWESPEMLTLGTHTVEFDFKYDGLGMETLAFDSPSGVGRGGTGVLKVDGKAVATQTMEHGAIHLAVGRKFRCRRRHGYAC